MRSNRPGKGQERRRRSGRRHVPDRGVGGERLDRPDAKPWASRLDDALHVGRELPDQFYAEHSPEGQPGYEHRLSFSCAEVGEDVLRPGLNTSRSSAVGDFDSLQAWRRCHRHPSGQLVKAVRRFRGRLEEGDPDVNRPRCLRRAASVRHGPRLRTDEDLPRVLHVTQPTTAGVARAVLALAEDQLRRGWDITVASPQEADLTDWLAAVGVRHETWCASRSPGPSLLGEVRRLVDVLDRVQPDLVHLHSSKAGAVGRLAVRGRIPTVFQPHAWSFAAVDGVLALATLRWERFAARWTDVVVCVSDGERSEGRSAGIRARWFVSRNGTDLTLYAVPDEAARAQARTARGLGDAPTALCVGRLCHQKGQDVLLEAWPAVRAIVPQAELLVVGDGPEGARLRALSSPGVQWCGHAPDVRPWLSVADVVVLPSRWEGLAYSMVEAMAMGRSVVTTAVHGSEDLAGAGVGAVVPVEDPAALAAALAERLAAPALAEDEGRAARHFAERHYDQRRQLDDLAARTVSLLRGAG